MAALPPSLTTRSCYLNYGTAEMSNLIAAEHFISKSKITHRPENVNVKNENFCGGSIKNLGNTRKNFDVRMFAAARVSVEHSETIFTRSLQVADLKKVATYLFRTEIGGQVKVFVRKRNDKYAVNVEASSLQLCGNDSWLALVWGIHRSDSSCFMPVESQHYNQNAKTRTTENPFIKTSFSEFAIELELEAKCSPFYLSFLLKSLSNANPDGQEIKSHRKANFCVPIGFGAGYPAPLGLSFSKNGSMNFAFFSRNSENVVLCLYDDSTAEKPAFELDLDPYINRTGDVWHASVGSAWNYVSYGYKCRGPALQGDGDNFPAERILLDPYAKVIANVISDNNDSVLLPTYLGQLCKEPSFDWSGDVRLNLPMEKLVVYRLNVMCFTEHKSSKLPTNMAGTFLGLTEKVNHLKALGVNAVLLEPIFPFDEQKGPYFPCHFFSPMNIYGPGPVSTINSMKEMVKKLHANGIEVLMEVVFTHTADSGALQGIDDLCYYYSSNTENLGPRSNLNCNYPIVQQIILDSLHHWVTEFHVDGFSFVNAASLLRGPHGECLSRPPLVEAIAFDPLLSKTKIIADCWDPHGFKPKETHFPHWKRWAETNTKFCNDIRNFLRGEGLISDLATRLCGSGDIFSDGRGPAFSFNFIARNFGLPLVDLVSFSSPELSSQLSWNCGEEGPTTNTAVLERRLKQIRNFLFILYVSLGVPVLNMGDECGQSSRGSPSYGDKKALDWNTLATGFGIQITQFISFLSSLRMRRSDVLQSRNFLKEENIDWHGSDHSEPRWEDPSCKFLAMTLKADEEDPQSSQQSGDLFIAFNAAEHSESVILPPLDEGIEWRRLVDTALPFPGFFSISGDPVPEQMAGLVAYEMKSYSCTLFEASSGLSG
ncbi:isoamylase 2, chloroplastic [Carica papaya]|uniref:isoamylase 2, chloroplastic n=1 Tax=Carica papaya TaxID=3649 RepID=UPI000B8C7255|nr:isoamylase 2, chloroplastic [Carica papaya]XP_021907701.1 isoamylase 2, chloroplastic [Carica papaya]